MIDYTKTLHPQRQNWVETWGQRSRTHRNAVVLHGRTAGSRITGMLGVEEATRIGVATRILSDAGAGETVQCAH